MNILRIDLFHNLVIPVKTGIFEGDFMPFRVDSRLLGNDDKKRLVP